MPLPLSHLTMETIAAIVDKWRKGEVPSDRAVDLIGAKTITFQKIEWALNHGGDDEAKRLASDEGWK